MGKFKIENTKCRENLELKKASLGWDADEFSNFLTDRIQ